MIKNTQAWASVDELHAQDGHALSVFFSPAFQGEYKQSLPGDEANAVVLLFVQLSRIKHGVAVSSLRPS